MESPKQAPQTSPTPTNSGGPLLGIAEAQSRYCCLLVQQLMMQQDSYKAQAAADMFRALLHSPQARAAVACASPFMLARSMPQVPSSPGFSLASSPSPSNNDEPVPPPAKRFKMSISCISPALAPSEENANTSPSSLLPSSPSPKRGMSLKDLLSSEESACCKAFFFHYL